MSPDVESVMVCTTCYFMHHYGFSEGDSEESNAASLAGYERWGGVFTDNTYANGDNPVDPDDTGVWEFSWSPCPVCRSSLGGARNRLAWWDE